MTSELEKAIGVVEGLGGTVELSEGRVLDV